MIKNEKIKASYRNILLAEDDLTLQAFWDFVLRKIDTKPAITWVTTEESAERMIRQRIVSGQRFDLVIADITLLGKRNGIDLWRRYGQDGCNFILTSSMPLDELRTRHTGLRLPAYIQKPLHADKCIELLRQNLNNSEQLNITLSKGATNGSEKVY